MLLGVMLTVSCAVGAPFRFVLLGDRTGEEEGVASEKIWKKILADAPAFVVCSGDLIEGLHDATAADQWLAFKDIRGDAAAIPFYSAPGNHDIWSEESERLFRQETGHPLHYGFDYANLHFTILDNSRSDQLAPEELAFLESDLKAHAAQPIKIIVSHRPSWLINVAVKNPDFPLHKIAKRYGVQYVIAGHIHQMLRLQLDGITYVSLPSAGGHLRLTSAYPDGWFFGYTLVTVDGDHLEFQVNELPLPYGQGRTTKLEDWGMAGLIKKPPVSTPLGK